MNRRMFFGSLAVAGGALTLKPEVEPFKEGDVLVIESDDYLSVQAMANLQETAKRVIPEGMTVLVLDCGLKAKLLRPETIDALVKARG